MAWGTVPAYFLLTQRYAKSLSALRVKMWGTGNGERGMGNIGNREEGIGNRLKTNDSAAFGRSTALPLAFSKPYLGNGNFQRRKIRFPT